MSKNPDVRKSFRVMQIIDTRNKILNSIEEIDCKRIDLFAQSLFLHKKHWIYIAGNGGSCMNAGHFAEDLESYGFKVKWLGGNPGRATALMNDKPRDDFYTLQMNGFTSQDALVVFTVHGCTGQQEAGPWSRNIYEAVKYAKFMGGSILGFSGLNGGDLALNFRGNFLTCSSGDVEVVEPFHDAMFHLVLYTLKMEEFQ